MRAIRASEIGAFLYCRRAWWYQRQGLKSENRAEMAGGSEYHLRHGRQVLRSGLLRTAGWALILLALVVLAIGLTLALMR